MDKKVDNLIGYVTLPHHTGIADHALVFMLSGITSRWKQTVAYYFTGSSVDGSVFKDIVLDIITKAEAIKLKVIGITSDMGTANQRMWKAFGINVTRKECITKITHPVDESRFLHFLADPPHILKNIRNFLISGQKIIIGSTTVQKYSLSSNEITQQPVQALYETEKNSTFKLAPKLTNIVLQPGQFDKMKVVIAKRFFDKSVEAGTVMQVKNTGWSNSCLSTAWFLGIIRQWFDLMTSRTPLLALSKFDEIKYEAAIQLLKDVVELFQTSKFGESWKPIQTAVILSTKSVLNLQNDILNEGHLFFLTSRLSQDCLENLFSCIRIKSPTPAPLQFKFNLRIISVSQYLKTAKNSNYDKDSATYCLDLTSFKQTEKNKKKSNEDIEDAMCEELATICLTLNEEKAFKNIAGYCVSQLSLDCSVCKNFVVQSTEQDAEDFIALKCYKPNCLTRPSADVLQLLHNGEFIFRQKLVTMYNGKNLREALINSTTQNFEVDHFPSCHDIVHKLLKTFFNIHLHAFSRDINAKENGEDGHVTRSSKSIAMREAVALL